MSTVVNQAAGAAAAPVLSPQEIAKQIKPLSNNSFAAFFQRIWRGWLAVWYGFADRHPKLSKAIYMVVFFIVFSEGVTIWQFIIMTFMPYLFGGLNQVDFVWPATPLKDLLSPEGKQLFYAIFNEPAAAEGKLGGLGNFLAFEIAVFTAQCINFPLQRNITFKSHGNPWWQAMWYFIGWVFISVFVNALWGIMNPFMIAWEWNFVVVGLIKTVVTGGLSMAIFFPIFWIIFPDYNAVEKRARKKLEKLKAAGADAEKTKKAEAAVADAAMKAKLSNTEKAASKATTQASSKAMAYFATESAAERAKAEIAALEKSTADGDKAKLEQARKAAAEYAGLTITRQKAASEAIDTKDKAIEAFKAASAEAKSMKAATAAV